MYTKEQKERALKEFERLGSVQAVVTLLGYPSRHTLYEWYRKKIADITDYHDSLDKEYIIKQKYINKPNHPRNPDTSLKLDVIKRCFSLGEGVEYVSRDIGYSRASIYSWYRKYKKFGVAGLMSSKKQIKRENIDFNIEPSEQQDILRIAGSNQTITNGSRYTKRSFRFIKKRSRHQYDETEKS